MADNGTLSSRVVGLERANVPQGYRQPARFCFQDHYFSSTYEVNVFMFDQNEQTSFYLRNELIEKNYVRKATFLLTLLGRY